MSKDSNEEEVPYVKRKSLGKHRYKKIEVEKIKEDPMNPYNPDHISRSIDIEKLAKKLNKLKVLPNINTRTRTDQIYGL